MTSSLNRIIWACYWTFLCKDIANGVITLLLAIKKFVWANYCSIIIAFFTCCFFEMSLGHFSQRTEPQGVFCTVHMSKSATKKFILFLIYWNQALIRIFQACIIFLGYLCVTKNYCCREYCHSCDHIIRNARTLHFGSSTNQLRRERIPSVHH